MTLRWSDHDRTLHLSVRDLLESAPPAGHLVLEVAQTRNARMAAGRAAHTAWQSERQAADEAYRAELGLKHTWEVDGWTLVLQGRVDGLSDEGGHTIVEEVKATALEGETLATSGASAWPSWVAQLEVYVWMLSRGGWPAPLGRLVLVSLLDGSRHVVPVPVDVDVVEANLQRRAARLVRLRERRLAWLAARRRQVVPKPFKGWRQGQQVVADGVRSALSEGQRLLVQAPTGLGKTAAVLHGALAFAFGADRQLFWATSRTTQVRGVTATLDRFRERGLPLSYVVVRAKEKVCLNDVVACRPDTCVFARDYHDKIEASRVVEDAVDARGLLPERAMELGAQHEVCPHALLLDVAEHVDVVVGDINHALSPSSRIKRLFTDTTAPERVLVVDECHQLVDRARDHASPQVSATDARAAAAALGVGMEPYQEIARDVLAAIQRTVRDTPGPWRDGQAVAELVLRPWQDLADRIDQLAFDHALLRARAGRSSTGDDPYLALSWQVLRFAQTAEEATETTVALVNQTPGQESVRLLCLDPSGHLRPAIAALGGFVGCSATLAPHDYYQRLLGLPDNTGRLDVPSPFPAEHRKVLLATRVSTKFADRTAHAPATASLLSRAAAAVPGNVAIYFSSFAMLADLMGRFDPGEAEVLTQPTSISEGLRATFLDRLSRPGKVVFAAVLGGIFAEGVDLPPGALSAVFVVGPALPPVGLERELLREHHEARFGQGFRYASLVPGMTRVVQGAGRLHRRPEDRGVILLVDRRFRWPEYASLLPPHWEPEVVDEPADAIAAFFGGVS